MQRRKTQHLEQFHPYAALPYHMTLQDLDRHLGKDVLTIPITADGKGLLIGDEHLVIIAE